MKVYLGSDHGGFALKESIKGWLTEWGYTYEDCGNTKLDSRDDYPDYALSVAQKVASDNASEEKETDWPKMPSSFGILGCRSAIGVVMAANKVRGIRAGAAIDKHHVEHGRANDNINILALSGDWLDEAQAKEIVHAFLTTEYSQEERHSRRLDKIKAYENR